MTSPTRFSPSENRFGADRRRGGDSRTPEERRRQGERRSGADRRGAEGVRNSAQLSPRAATWLHVWLTAALFIFADVRFFQGVHSVRLAVEGGGYASGLASHWVNSGFGR